MAVTANNVLFYYPNIVGYLRVIFMILSFYYAKISWQITFGFYMLAFFGDVVDGYVARLCNQCSKFGGILDMVTDRLSTCGFLVILTQFYPDYTFPLLMLIVIDIGSHWFHVMSVTAHHKSGEALLHRNILLRKYYEIYPLFGYCCVGTELFYVALYLIHFNPSYKLLAQICWYGCFPACLLKQLVNIAQLLSAMYAIAEADAINSNNAIGSTSNISTDNIPTISHDKKEEEGRTKKTEKKKNK